MQPTTTNPETLQSQVIDLLRFPLIIGVVFIHNASPTLYVQGVEFGSSGSLPIHHVCSQLFSEILGRVAVPLFFLISGFLFFLNVDFNKQTYVKKLRARAKTLLIPYLFWNGLSILFYFVIRYVPSLDFFVNQTHRFEFTSHYLLQTLWGVADGTTMPIVGPLWFIRDLMVVIVLTPFIYTYVKRLRVYGILLLSVLWVFGWWFSLLGMSMTAIFFFALGAWISISRRNLVLEAEKVKYPVFVLYPLLVTAEFLTKDWGVHTFIQDAGVLCGILFWINIGISTQRTMVIRPTKFLSTAAFFVFAVHEPWLMGPARTLVFVWLNPSSDAALTAWYFVIVITVVLCGLGSYYVLRKISPSFTNFITGGR
ncbi:MAG: acyltransferase [Tannerellaceae bacterium]|jgi:fucose 4-O-acetylase-like acetyltransferase|nr:acyltransferase [Tannerellaceae bacterium]